MRLNAGKIDLNGSAGPTLKTPRLYPTTTMPDTKFNNSTGWQVKDNELISIVTRAPTHEPYPYHNKGVPVATTNSDGKNTPPPAAEPVETNWSIIRTA
jgi:FtsP/CotA-like multicopper oxidase with cupredoxin domain